MRTALAALRSRIWALLVLLALLGLFGCSRPPGNCEPSAFYGPPPCNEDQDCIDDHGIGWYCDLRHTVDDGCGNPVSWPECKEGTCEPSTFYGPPECSQDQACIDRYGFDWMCDLDRAVDDGCGTLVIRPACTNCEPRTFYGPMPCTDDQDCIDEYGQQWYCDESNVFYDGCGNPVSWPYCIADDCQPATYYGPPPCIDDQACIDEHGTGWYCDESNSFYNGCATYDAYPICRDAECAPMVYYGPPPCTDDQACIDEHGAGWYCDLQNAFSDTCDNLYEYAACKPEP